MNLSALRAPWLLAVARVFADAGQPVYAVGGLVRNAVMELPPSDADLCGPARPQAVLRLCEGTPVHAVLRAAHFGTVELHVSDAQGRHMAEYTTFRVDSYRCGHLPSAVRFADTLEEDALRRDFSVNALYTLLSVQAATHAEVMDPTGGLAHLRAGVLHTVTPDPDQVLKDDGLRILRAARFQAELGLRPSAALLASAARYAHLLQDIAPERLREELTKLLKADQRYPTLSRREPPVPAGLSTLLRVGAWPALFGTLAPDGAAIAATAHYHPPEGMPPAAGKLALLFYACTPAALAACMQRLRFSVRETGAAQVALAAQARVLAGDCPLMAAVRLGMVPMAQAEAALQALVAAGLPLQDALALAQQRLSQLRTLPIPLSLRALAIHGDDVLPLCQAQGVPQARIGSVLDTLWQATVEGALPNQREALLAEAGRLLAASR